MFCSLFLSSNEPYVPMNNVLFESTKFKKSINFYFLNGT